MKKITNILLTAALVFGAFSCARETPFHLDGEGDGFGRVLTSSLAVQLREDTRAGDSSYDVSDFLVSFYNVTDMETPVASYTYREMPEIVTLPAGVTYTVVASYGENQTAAFNAPYYKGESEEFAVEVDKIVDNLSPIVCKLCNVKVTVNFDQELVRRMSADSRVNVKVGKSGELTYTTSTNESGYFAYVEGSCSLAATFSGTVDGQETYETKTYDDVKPGTHYNITFRLHTPNAGGTGSVSAGGDDENDKGITLDANVVIDTVGGDSGVDVGAGDEITLEDQTERPSEDPENPDDPNKGDDPNNPDDPNKGDEPTPPSESGPTVTPFIPEGTSGTLVDLDKVNDADGLVCAFMVDSNAETGFIQFEVDIFSDKLTEGDLAGIGLAQHLDLAVTPEALEEPLFNLGFPTNVKAETHAEFDITGFMPMLMALGSGEHTFKLTISDENGTTVINLRIKC